MKLTKKEQAWLDRLERTLDAAPKSLFHKVSAFTIGDNYITLYDEKKVDAYSKTIDTTRGISGDMPSLVDNSGGEIREFIFPFKIDSAAG